MWPDSSRPGVGHVADRKPVVTGRLIQVTRGVEQVLFLLACALALWALLSAAERHYYASLPVPTSPAVATPAADILPGDAGTNATQRPQDRTIIPPGTWVARLRAPSLGLSATVIEGSTDDVLARAAGHIEGTALPGQAGNVGIAGHRDTTFRPLRHVKVGDLLSLQTTAGTQHYRVERTLIVNPEDVQVLDPTERPTLTLVTCYPFTFLGHAPKRFIVRATAIQ